MPSSKPAPFPRRPRCHFSRSRAGCLTCRTRRKKCDEAKPICGGCERGKRKCTWPSPGNNTSVPPPVEPYGPGIGEITLNNPSTVPVGLPPGIVPVRIVTNQPAPKPVAPQIEVPAGFQTIQEQPSQGMESMMRLIPSSSPEPYATGVLPTSAHIRQNSGQWSRSSDGIKPGSVGQEVRMGSNVIQVTPEPPPSILQSRMDPFFDQDPVSQDGLGLQASAVLPSTTVVPPGFISEESYITPQAYLRQPSAAGMRSANMPAPDLQLGYSGYVKTPYYGVSQQVYQPIPAAEATILLPVTSISAIMSPAEYLGESPVNQYPSKPLIPGESMSGIQKTEILVDPRTVPNIPQAVIPLAPLATNSAQSSMHQTPSSSYIPPIYPANSFTPDGPRHTSFSSTSSNSADLELPSTMKNTSALRGSVITSSEPDFSSNPLPRNSQSPTPIRISGYVNVAENGNVTKVTPEGETILGSMTEQQFAEYIGKFTRLDEEISPSSSPTFSVVKPIAQGASSGDAYDVSHSNTSTALTRKEQKLQIVRKKRIHDVNESAMNYAGQGQSLLASSRKNRKELASSTRNQKNFIRIARHFTLPRNVMEFSNNTQLDPRSHLLFKHYLDHVADQIVTNVGDINPLRSFVLPLAQKDDILMHSMLAVGGAYFSFKNSVNPELGYVSRKHYAIALSRLRPAIQSNRYTDDQDQIYLMTILLLLSMFEILCGSTHGSILMHLNASRTVLNLVISNGYIPAPDSHTGLMFGFLSECYAFTCTMAGVASFLSERKVLIPIDHFVRDLTYLRNYPTCRSMLGVGHSLFQILVEIIDLGMERLAEEEKNEASVEVFHKYRALLKRIIEWVDPDDDGTMRSDWRNASIVYQHAMVILLHNIYYADIRTDPDVWADVNQRVETAFPLLLSVALSSNVGANMLFPVMVFASSTEEEWLRGTLRYGIMVAKFKSCSMKQSLILLQKLWDDPAPEAFGPRGLGHVMKKYGVIFTLI